MRFIISPTVYKYKNSYLFKGIVLIISGGYWLQLIALNVFIYVVLCWEGVAYRDMKRD